jgi:hypothetical protein
LLLETHLDDGGTARTWIEHGALGLGLRREGFAPEPEFLPLLPGVVQRVMTRYGGVPSDEVATSVALVLAELVLEDASTLSSFRFRPRYDVIAKDYVVWRPVAELPRLELAVSVAAALTHLARAALALGHPESG